jgi:fibro-slime domain-containing protein
MKKTLVQPGLILALTLAASTAFAASTTLTGTVRDFQPGILSPGTTNPDFESGIGGLQPGLVSPTLTGSAPTPVLFGAPGYITSAASFAEWYGSAAPSTSYAITLNETFAGSGIYAYSSSSFFPIDGQLLGNQSLGHNYHFTYQIAATFGYIPGANQTFSFTGDDDVWVFFDKELGIDLGGVHGAASQTVNMDTLLSGKAAGNYAFDLFFAERHTSESNLAISTSLNLVQTPVPAPAGLALLGLGSLGLAFVRRKKAGVSGR